MRKYFNSRVLCAKTLAFHKAIFTFESIMQFYLSVSLTGLTWYPFSASAESSFLQVLMYLVYLFVFAFAFNLFRLAVCFHRFVRLEHTKR